MKCKVTGKMSYKQYKCCKCGHEKKIQTNHWGECYSFGTYNRCPNCGRKNPMEGTVWDCQEPLPTGYVKPEPWKMGKLGDITKII